MGFFAPRRIAVCGSSRGLSAAGALYCQALGEALGRHSNLIVVNRGIKRSKTPEGLAADYLFIEGAKKSMPPSERETRIETYISQNTAHERFTEGRILPARGKSAEARRFFTISKVDALMAMAGGPGTNQQIVLADALDLPILPVGCFGGASQEFWQSNRAEIVERLKLTVEDCAVLDSASPPLDSAARLAARLIDALERRCFVIMPYSKDMVHLFDTAIAPAVARFGDRAIHLDRAGLPGDVGAQIEQGIASCDYAVVVLEHQRANVFYELGMAHALRKPTIILSRAGDADPPFDISMHQRIEYDCVDAKLSGRIANAIASFSRLRLGLQFMSDDQPGPKPPAP